MPLSRTLHVELTDLAKSLQRHGRGKDSVLAHITPKEAALLKARGGRGSTNPVTGLLEFDDSFDLSPVSVTPSNFSPAPDVSAAPDVSTPVQTQNVGSAPVVSETGQTTAQAQPSTLDFSYFPGLSQAAQVAPAPQAAQAAPAQVAPVATAPATPAATAAPGQVTQNVPTPTARPSYDPNLDQGDQSTNAGVTDWLNNNKTLLELGGLGALGLYGGINSSRAAGQAAALQNNLANIATPTLTQGTQALSGVQSGALTPANIQALQAVQAQTAQGQKSGAVSSQQAAEAVSTTFANLLNNQLNQALALLNTADGYLQTAYIQGYQANIANQTNTQNFYSNLAQLAARMAGVGGGTTINLGAGG